jgi:hypothetical protein
LLLNPNGVPKIPLIFLGKKNCKDLDVGQGLTEFSKIPMFIALNIFLKNKLEYFENFDRI